MTEGGGVEVGTGRAEVAGGAARLGIWMIACGAAGFVVASVAFVVVVELPVGSTLCAMVLLAVAVVDVAARVAPTAGADDDGGATVEELDAGVVTSGLASAGSARAPTNSRTPTTVPPTHAVSFLPLLQVAGADETANGRSVSLTSSDRRPVGPARRAARAG